MAIDPEGSARLQVWQDRELIGAGTAFRIGIDLIATAFHVVGDRRLMAWTSDIRPSVRCEILLVGGTSIEVVPLLADIEADVAVLRMLEPSNDLLILPIADRKPKKKDEWSADTFPAFHNGDIFALTGEIDAVREHDWRIQLRIAQTAGVKWNGVSGSPVLIEGHVAGLLTEVTEGTSVGWAAMVEPMQLLLRVIGDGFLSDCIQSITENISSPEDINRVAENEQWDPPLYLGNGELVDVTRAAVREVFQRGEDPLNRLLQSLLPPNEAQRLMSRHGSLLSTLGPTSTKSISGSAPQIIRRSRKPMARRLIVVSDLHLTVSEPRLMSHPGDLATFIRGLPACLRDDERLELVIAGDFLDFVSMPGWVSWSPRQAVDALTQIMSGTAAVVFDALAEHIAAGHQLTVIIGAFDTDLVLPQVQECLRKRLGVEAPDVYFVDDGSAYRVGEVLIEHGSQYDSWNANDWSALRAYRSDASRRGLGSLTRRSAPAGAKLAHQLSSSYFPKYPWLSLIQPSHIAAQLLFAIDPKTAMRMSWRAMRSLPLGKTLTSKPEPKYATESSSSFCTSVRLMWSGATRSARIQRLLANVLQNDRSCNTDDDSGVSGVFSRIAENLRVEGVRTVVFGHTHLARHIGPSDCAYYINTGTWTDVIRVPIPALQLGNEGEGAFTDFMLGLVQNEDTVRTRQYSYADIRVNLEGAVEVAQLRVFSEENGFDADFQ